MWFRLIFDKKSKGRPNAVPTLAEYYFRVFLLCEIGGSNKIAFY